MHLPLGPGKAGTHNGTKRTIHTVMRATGVARLALRVSGVMHRHRRRFGHSRHARMRKGQHDKQRKHEAEAKQQMADGKASVFAQHEIGLGREVSQIKSRLGVRIANGRQCASDRGKCSAFSSVCAFRQGLRFPRFPWPWFRQDPMCQRSPAKQLRAPEVQAPRAVGRFPPRLISRTKAAALNTAPVRNVAGAPRLSHKSPATRLAIKSATPLTRLKKP